MTSEALADSSSRATECNYRPTYLLGLSMLLDFCTRFFYMKLEDG